MRSCRRQFSRLRIYRLVTLRGSPLPARDGQGLRQRVKAPAHPRGLPPGTQTRHPGMAPRQAFFPLPEHHDFGGQVVDVVLDGEVEKEVPRERVVYLRKGKECCVRVRARLVLTREIGRAFIWFDFLKLQYPISTQVLPAGRVSEHPTHPGPLSRRSSPLSHSLVLPLDVSISRPRRICGFADGCRHGMYTQVHRSPKVTG